MKGKGNWEDAEKKRELPFLTSLGEKKIPERASESSGLC